MSRKINFSKEDTQKIIYMYTQEKLGLASIGNYFHCSKPVIKRILQEQNIPINVANNQKYKEGDIVGPYNILLIEKFSEYYSKNGIKQRNIHGKFLCPNHPKNDPHYFVATISGVNNGHKIQCEECSKKSRLENLNHYMERHKVDLTNKKSGKLLFLRRLEDERGSDGSYMWECVCECGTVCKVSVNNFGKTQSCGCLISKGELLIKTILNNSNIKYKTQYIFNNCINPKTNFPLKFDFYLPDYNCCIEYDGEQHFKYRDTGWNTKENLKETQLRDNIKNEYCKNNNIKLIRIPYTDYDILDEKYLLEKIKGVA